MAYGTALASFNVEEFGTERVARLPSAEIDERVAELAEITRLDLVPADLDLPGESGRHFIRQRHRVKRLGDQAGRTQIGRRSRSAV